MDQYTLRESDQNDPRAVADFRLWSSGINPKTKRKIKIGGPTWLRVARERQYVKKSPSGEKMNSSKEDGRALKRKKKSLPRLDCPICLEEVSSTKIVSCCACQNQTCLNCTIEYLKDYLDRPQCPNPDCRVRWTRSFLEKNFPRSWFHSARPGGYRYQLKELLLEKEKAGMEEANNILNSPYRTYREQLHRIEEEQPDAISLFEYFQKASVWEGVVMIKRIKNGGFSIKKYLYHCPLSCNGLVDSNHQCAVCQTQFCSKCHEGLSESHRCNPLAVAGAKKIREETQIKPCPQCAGPIFKTGGCDQMACSRCKIAFSWRTGRIESQNIHNPYMINWMRQNHQLPRARGDEICGGIPNIIQIERIVGEFLPYFIKNMKYYRLYRVEKILTRVGETRDRIQKLQEDLDMLEYRKLFYRVRHLVGKLPEDKWKQRVFTLYRDHLRADTECQILQTLVDTSTVRFREYIRALSNPPKEISEGQRSTRSKYLLRESLNLIAYHYHLRNYINQTLEKELKKIGYGEPPVISWV